MPEREGRGEEAVDELLAVLLADYGQTGLAVGHKAHGGHGGAEFQRLLTLEVGGPRAEGYGLVREQGVVVVHHAVAVGDIYFEP